MTKEEFKEIQEALGFTIEGIAKYLGVSKRTIDFYRSGKVPVPGPVSLALKLTVKHNGD